LPGRLAARSKEKLANRTIKGIDVEFSNLGLRVHALLSTFFYDELRTGFGADIYAFSRRFSYMLSSFHPNMFVSSFVLIK
jgi:hypothetical protein